MEFKNKAELPGWWIGRPREFNWYFINFLSKTRLVHLYSRSSTSGQNYRLLYRFCCVTYFYFGHSLLHNYLLYLIMKNTELLSTNFIHEKRELLSFKPFFILVCWTYSVRCYKMVKTVDLFSIWNTLWRKGSIKKQVIYGKHLQIGAVILV